MYLQGFVLSEVSGVYLVSWNIFPLDNGGLLYHILLLYSSTDGHLGCFHLIAIMNATALNVDVHIPPQGLAFNTFGNIPRSGMTP
jgi:hypothetical protein